MQGISSDSTFEKLIYSYGAMQSCKSARDKFVLCRSTPHGKEADPAHCESHVNELMTCYTSMVHKSQDKWNKQYQSTFECLKQHEGEKASGSVCARNLDEFAKCI